MTDNSVPYVPPTVFSMEEYEAICAKDPVLTFYRSVQAAAKKRETWATDYRRAVMDEYGEQFAKRFLEVAAAVGEGDPPR